jgi:hypothetical protein
MVPTSESLTRSVFLANSSSTDRYGIEGVERVKPRLMECLVAVQLRALVQKRTSQRRKRSRSRRPSTVRLRVQTKSMPERERNGSTPQGGRNSSPATRTCSGTTPAKAITGQSDQSPHSAVSSSSRRSSFDNIVEHAFSFVLWDNRSLAALADLSNTSLWVAGVKRSRYGITVRHKLPADLIVHALRKACCMELVL